MKGNRNLGTFPSHATIWRNQFKGACHHPREPEFITILLQLTNFFSYPNIHKKATDIKRALANKREKRGEVAPVCAMYARNCQCQFNNVR